MNKQVRSCDFNLREVIRFVCLKFGSTYRVEIDKIACQNNRYANR